MVPCPAHIPDIVTAGLDTVALRVPNHAVARRLIEISGLPLAAPSANRSGAISPTRAEHVLRSLQGNVEMILDAGPTNVGIESTVVGLSPPRLLRRGHVSRNAIETILGPLQDLTSIDEADPAAPASPGMALRHYAPDAEVVLVAPGDADALAKAMGPDTGALLRSLTSDAEHVEVLPDDPEGYARGLYAALHRLDRTCNRLVIESVPDDEAWAAIRDRLERAARSDVPALQTATAVREAMDVALFDRVRDERPPSRPPRTNVSRRSPATSSSSPPGGGSRAP